MGKIDYRAICEANHWVPPSAASPNEGDNFWEWAAARDVDPDDLHRAADEVAEEMLLRLEAPGKGSMRAALTGVALQMFITGFEAERRRRDSGVLG